MLIIAFSWESVKSACRRLGYDACPSVETVNSSKGGIAGFSVAACGIGSTEGTPVTAQFGFVAGRPDEPIEPPSEWALEPVSVTPTAFTLRSVDKTGAPDTHWWRRK